MTVPPVDLAYLARYGYVALFVIIAFGEFYSFLPGGVVLIAVGALSRSHYFGLALSLFVATAASSLSDAIVFTIAKRVGSREGYRRFVERNRFAKRIEEYMATHPRATVFFSRFTGIASTPVNAIAGLSQMRLPVFLAYDILANIICCGAYLLAGYYLGGAFEADVSSVVLGLGILAVFMLGGYALYRLLSSRPSA